MAGQDLGKLLALLSGAVGGGVGATDLATGLGMLKAALGQRPTTVSPTSGIGGAASGSVGFGLHEPIVEQGPDVYPDPNPVTGTSPGLLQALIQQESSGNPRAVSNKGAQGLMQLMPATAQEYAGKLGLQWDPKKLQEPNYNMTLGKAVLDDYTKKFGGDPFLGLAAYNAGPTRVRAALGEGTAITDAMPNLPKETRDYVHNIALALSGGMGPVWYGGGR